MIPKHELDNLDLTLEKGDEAAGEAEPEQGCAFLRGGFYRAGQLRAEVRGEALVDQGQGTLTAYCRYFDRREPSGDDGPRSAALAGPERDALFQDLQPLVCWLLSWYGREYPELKEELPGEIYYRFSTLYAAYDPSRGIPLRPYLVRMLKASLYTYARRHRTHRRRELSLEGAETFPVSCLAVHPAEEWDRSLEVDAILEALPAALKQLSPRQQLVLRRRHGEDRSFEEIAAELQVRPATARSLLRHGLNRLRHLMEHRQPDAP